MPSPYLPQFSPVTSLWQNQRIAVPLSIVLITVLIVTAFKLLQPEPPVKEKQEKSWIVKTSVLSAGAKTPQLELFGTVESPYTSSLTATVTADVASLNVREGQRVKQGDNLVVLDDSEERLVVEQRRSEVSDIEAQIKSEKNRHQNDLAALKLEKSLVALAEKKLQREEKTSQSNLTSKSSYDTQKQALQSQQLALKARQLNIDNHPARLAQLQARLKQKQAQAEQSEKDLTRTTVTAPFDGIILNTHVSPGERVRTGENLLDIYATDQVELRAQLPQKHIDEIRRALADGNALPATARTVTGDISVSLHRISGSLVQAGSGIDALFQVSNEDAAGLLIGEVLDVVVALPAIENVYSVPVSSLYGTDRIYRVRDQRLEMIQVEKLGNHLLNNHYHILVSSDQLNDGDEVITTQLPHAVSGLKVETRTATPAGTITGTAAQ